MDRKKEFLLRVYLVMALAISLPFFEIRMDTRAKGLDAKTFNQNVGALAEKLAANFMQDQNAKQIKNWLIKEHKAKNQYLLIARNLDYAQMQEIKSYPLFNLGQNKGGIIIIRKSRREKPYKILANRTIGLNRDSFAIGLENSFNNELKGKDGERMMRKVAPKVYIPVDNVTEVEAKKGNDVVTTLNIGMQEVAEEALAESITKHAAEKGCAIVMETKTGAIKAIANLGLNEMGELNGGITYFYNEKMEDSEIHGVGRSDLSYSFYKSSNVGISKLANGVFGNNKVGFADYYYKWNLQKKTGIEIGGEPNPVVKHPSIDKDKWYGTTLPWMSIGYEMQLTPLQILTFYNSVANDGKMMKPYIVSDIKNDEEIVKTIRPIVVKDSMFSYNTLRMTKELLLQVVEKGTASSIKTEAYSIAGKTGTAVSNYFKSNEGKKEYQSSFCGYFPAENPKYSIIVVIYNPKVGGFYGAAVAAPVFRKISDHCMRLESAHAIVVNNQPKPSLAIENLPIGNVGNYNDFKAIFDYIGLPFHQQKKAQWIRTVSDNTGVLTMPLESSENLVPNVVGMGLRDAMYILDKSKIPSKPIGVGKVRTQSIAPGEINYGTTIELYLE